MAQNIGLEVVAEGAVEQADFLRMRNCEETQGYYFARPLDADAFARFLREHRAVHREVHQEVRLQAAR